MKLLKYIFGCNDEQSANVAKERLQIIIAHERDNRKNNSTDYLVPLQKEIIDVIAKYVKVDKDQIKVELEQSGENRKVLALNVTMPEEAAVEV